MKKSADDYSCSAFGGLPKLNNETSGKKLPLSSSDMQKLQTRMESMDTPEIPEDIQECEFDMEGNWILGSAEDLEVEQFAYDGEIPTHDFIKETLLVLDHPHDVYNPSPSEFLTSPDEG